MLMLMLSYYLVMIFKSIDVCFPVWIYLMCSLFPSVLHFVLALYVFGGSLGCVEGGIYPYFRVFAVVFSL